MIRWLAFILASLVSVSSRASTDDRCFRIPLHGGPGALGAMSKSERWCYRDHWSPDGSVFAYNADGEEAKPELAFIIEPDDTLTHASLTAGKIEVHKVEAIGFSPFSVPLRTPLALDEEKNPLARDERFEKSVTRVHEILSRTRLDGRKPIASLKIEPGTFQGSVPAEAMPFRGYYWPTRGYPLASAMQKFDRFAKSRGVNSKAFEWERDQHEWSGISWAGHCNGWAASAVLRPEPKTAKFDERSGVVFKVSDVKGLYAERDYCVSYSFYGRRYPNGVLTDITPAQFHHVLTYNVGTIGRPVAVDLTRTRPVFNNVFSAYRTHIARIDSDEYEVTTEVRDHNYDSVIDERVGRAPSVTVKYRYQLKTDSRGNVIGGKWLTVNPDFLWVPLSGAKCTDENPYLTDALLSAIEKLPAPPANSN